jgi:hypothetical protein
VCEAKLFSPLSKGTTRAPGFDQAARNVACMAEALRRAAKPVSAWASLGFFVLAPKSQIDAGVFADEISRCSIRRKIETRISAYEPESRCRLEAWMRQWVEPLVASIRLCSLAWEDLLDAPDPDLQSFYQHCLRFNSI